MGGEAIEGDLTEDDLDRIESEQDMFLGRLQERYG